MQANLDVRQAAKDAGIYLWEVAAAIGVNDGNFSRRLRKELPQAEKTALLRIINELAQAKHDEKG